MGRCIIVAGGDSPQSELALGIIKSRDFLICADSGANHLFSLGIKPDIILGDLDSIDKTVLSANKADHVQVIEYPCDKDKTDTELAIDLALEKGFSEIYLLAAVGSRIDHSLANITLLVPYWHKELKLVLVTDNTLLYLAKEEEIIVGRSGDLVSLLPLSATVENITLEGFKYPLINEQLTFGTSRGISNLLLVDQGKITFSQGILLVIHQPIL